MDYRANVAWPYLPELASRLHISQAIAGLDFPISRFIRDHESNSVLAAIPAVIAGQRPADEIYRTKQLNEPEGYAPISSHFSEISATLNRREGHRADKSEKAKQILETVLKSLDYEPCHSCCQPHSLPVCQWTESTAERDLLALRDRGRCVAPATEMFRFALGIAVDAYEPFVIAGAPLISQHMYIGRLTQRSSDLDASVAGWTRQHRIGEITESIVGARIWEQEFTVTDFMVLLYVMVHECVAHAYCGVQVDDTESTASIAFQEGWMDEVAALLLEDVLTSDVESLQGSGRARYGLQFLNEMAKARSSRLKLLRPNSSKDASIWIEGIEAFRALLMAFEAILQRDQRGNSFNLARANAVDLSLKINISSITHAQRGHFVSKICETFAPDCVSLQRQAREQNPHLDKAIQNYLKHGDANEFLHQVING